jgi:diguanylate cyclase (GGDEF)-like protein
MFPSETLYKLSGPANSWVMALWAYFLLVLSLSTIWIFKKRQDIESAVFYTLFISLLAQLIASILSGLSDKGIIEMVYLGALPFTILNILSCLTLSKLLLKKASFSDQLVYQNDALEKILVTLNGDNKQENFAEFMKLVCKVLQKESAATTCLILVHDQSRKGLYVESNILVHKQNVIENFSFKIEGIPEDFRDPSKFHHVTKDLSKRYPSTEFYQNIKAQAMISVPMLNLAKEPIGVLSLYFDKPSIANKRFINVINVCASRLASEYSQELLLNQLKETAYIDVRTKLPNLTSTHNVIAACANDLTKQSLSSVVLKFDIDNFSDVNRRYGFENAELVLQELASRLKSYSNDNIFIARTAGDEFTAIFRKLDTDFNHTIDLHWAAIQSCVQQPFVLSHTEIDLRCSAGSVIYPHQVPEGMDVMRCAEFALSQAKLGGKNKLIAFDADIAKRLNRQKSIERYLRILLENDDMFDNNMNDAKQMYLVFQPKVTATGDYVGAEALCRWMHPELGFIPPSEFIQVAESSNLIQAHGMWCIDQVCRHIIDWQSKSCLPNGRFSINVSAKQLDRDDFVERMLRVLKKYEINPSVFDIELTESDLMKNLQRSKLSMKRLQESGFTISLDDFGTGYSSLSHLRELPVNQLKIDRSFVNECHSKDGLSILQSIITLAKNMQLTTVAEGVEEDYQLLALQEMGCEMYQGYYFSRPLKADAFVEYLSVSSKK